MKPKNLNLVLYSGGQTQSNKKLHGALSDLVGVQSKKSLTYIPYCYEGCEVYFNRAKKRYSRFGFNQFHCAPVDRPMTKPVLEKMLSSDVIYLAGGNTFYFLYHLKKSGVLPKLKNYALSGGLLTGLSAGAIIMTPHIGLASYPSFDCDDNEVGLKKLNSLNLVNFEFFPHYNSTHTRLKNSLKKYSLKAKKNILASHDGGGVVVENGNNHLLGQNTLFAQGQCYSL